MPARLAEAIVQTDTRREQEAVAAWLARGEGRDLLTLADINEAAGKEAAAPSN